MECSYAKIGELGRDSARRRSSRTVRLMSACGLVAVLAVAFSVAVLAERVAIEPGRGRSRSGMSGSGCRWSSHGSRLLTE